MNHNNKWNKRWTSIPNCHKLRLLFSLALIALLLSVVWSAPSPFSPPIPQSSPPEVEQDLSYTEIAIENEENAHDLPNIEGTGDIRDTLTVLLIGVDNRPGESYISNTDTLIVANINKQINQIALLSIPRDTQVTYKHHGTVKINSIARLGGSYLETSAVVETLIGQKIDGFVVSNFAGFKKIVDIVGGITIDVEKDMQYHTGDPEDGEINLKKGVQRLNGDQALQYARFRNDELADIARTVRQQKVLKALATEILQLKNIPKMPQIVHQIYQAVDTNLGITELLGFADVFIRIDKYHIVSQTLPGKFVLEEEISYWKVNPQESKTVCKNLFFEGKTTTMFSEVVTAGERLSPLKSSSVSGTAPQNKPSFASETAQGQLLDETAAGKGAEQERLQGPTRSPSPKESLSEKLENRIGTSNIDEEKNAGQHIIFEVEEL